MTDITNDPVAAAAAQLQDAAPSSTEPTIIERIEEGLHSLEAKVEHLIHPESTPEVSTQAPEVAAEQPGESNGSESSAPSLSSENPANGASSPASTAPTTTDGSAESAAPNEPIFAAPAEPKVGLHDPAGAIRQHLVNIKKHLSLRGFEMELMQDVHRELAAIESYL